ncbi:MAG: hypothetical protein M0Z34_06855 [Nitrospiraceae bacterium]|nr:hypothetical protein [Nitrospiraceae bacterium]
MDQGNTDIAEAPLPTAGTLRARKSLPRQVLRFIAFNLRMLKMVRMGHH